MFYLETHDVWMLELLQEGDLPYGGAWHPFVLRLQSDLFHGHDLPCLNVLS